MKPLGRIDFAPLSIAIRPSGTCAKGTFNPYLFAPLSDAPDALPRNRFAVNPNPHPPNPPALQAENITLRRGGQSVLCGVRLSVPLGRWLAVAGPNGQGLQHILQRQPAVDERVSDFIQHHEKMLAIQNGRARFLPALARQFGGFLNILAHP